MKHFKYITCLLLIAACILIMAACDSSVRTIRLVGNAPKGYEWDYEMDDNAIVKEIERQYLDGNIPGTEDAPGYFTFTFKGDKPGQGQLKFYYTTKDNKSGTDYLSTIVYDVMVDSNGHITECKPIGATFRDKEVTEQGLEALEELTE